MLCPDVHTAHIFIQIDNVSTVAAVGKMGCSKSVEIDWEVQAIWNKTIAIQNWLTAAHISGIIKIKTEQE